MSSTGNSHEPTDIVDDEPVLPTSHLTRPSADAIIADEADDNALLGNESDSEPSRSRRNSQYSERRSSRRKSQLLAAPFELPVERTPTQTSFPNKVKRNSFRGALNDKNGTSESDMQAQIADLTNQVTGLNTKLVNSFMRISDLEDDLSDKQEQLTRHNAKVASLEKEREQHLAALNTGLLVEKAHVTSEMQKMMERVIEETAQRGKAISDKEKIESELDDLSSNLFSEANKMVAVERLARAKAEEKSQSMEERLRDTEEIMEQQQKRLAELQSIVEKSNQEGSAVEANGLNTAAGNTALQSASSKENLSASILPIEEAKFRLDIIPYTELRSFLNHLRKLRLQLAPFYSFPISSLAPNLISPSLTSPIQSRPNSPSPSQARIVSPGHQSALSNPFSAAGVIRHRDFPSLPSNVEQLISLPSQVSSLHFLRRINEEDCEPCLRLETAPGLNWLTRRQLQTSILEGNLLIEPVFGGGIYDEEEVRKKAMGSPTAACAMCGKVVVNVQLPGGGSISEGSTWMNTASNAANSLQASVGASFPSRDQTNSPPMHNGSTFLSASNNSTSQSSSITQKKSSSGLFSTLRNIGSGSPRPSTSRSISSSNAQMSNQSDGSSTLVEEDLFASRLSPIPTHIFRIGETSTSRYLLCPDYCLQRLRVICEFWGYIRHLERAVVLEGKLAWDDEQPSKVPEVPAKDSGSITQLEEKAEEFGSAKKEPEADREAKDDILASTKDVKSGGEKDGEDDHDVENHHTTSTHGSNTDDEDGFADAQSVHSASTVADDDQEEEEEIEEVHEIIIEESVTPTKELNDDGSVAVNTPGLPSLPPRATTKHRPVPALPPALPPRRSIPDINPVPTGPEPKRLLSAKGDTTLTWEERVWLEITRHRADMWSARIGIQKQN